VPSPTAGSIQGLADGSSWPPPARRRRPRRLARRILIGGAVLLLAFAGLSGRLLIWPTQGMPARVDAILTLAGPGNRLPVAVELAREHRASVLVVSQGHLGYGGPCPAPIEGVRIICFDPDPADTRGEAEYLGRLAQRNGWTSIVVVATPEQATRARLLVSRCYPGSVYVLTAPVPRSQVPYQVMYGWGALIKALTLQRAC
jgi:uncharacterized SAM-binding protein YcdF (DUF218 family)